VTRLWSYRKTDYGMIEMLLFCKAEEKHENIVDRMWRRASSVSSGLLNDVAAAPGSIKQRTSCRLYRGCEWRE